MTDTIPKNFHNRAGRPPGWGSVDLDMRYAHLLVELALSGLFADKNIVGSFILQRKLGSHAMKVWIPVIVIQVTDESVKLPRHYAGIRIRKDVVQKV